MQDEIDVATRARACPRTGNGVLDKLDLIPQAIEVLALACREIVEDHDLVALADEVLD